MLGFILLSCAPLDFLTLQLECLQKCVEKAIVVINTTIDVLPNVNGLTLIKNPIHVPVSPHHSGFHKAWFNCYKQLKQYDDVSHVILMASNEMYFRKGVEEYVLKQNVVNYGCNENFFNTSQIHYTNAKRSSLFQSIDFDEWVSVGQWEGSFFPKEFFDEICEKYSDLAETHDVGQSAEEVIIPSLCSKKYKYIGTDSNLLTKTYHLTSIKEAPLDTLDKPYYSVKRVRYDINPLVIAIVKRLM